MKTRIRLVHCDTLSCEPILRRAPDGALLCVSQCGDVYEPAPGNRVLAFRSEDQGEHWQALGSVYPESGEAVYATEVSVVDGVVSAYLQVHSGRFLNMRCVVMQSRDGGRNWVQAGEPPFFPGFCFVRGLLQLAGGVRNGHKLKGVIPGGSSMPAVCTRGCMPPGRPSRLADRGR